MRSAATDGPYGHFSEDGSEFVVTDPATPRAFDNFLWNEAIFSNVQQTGVGYADYQVGDGEAVQLLTGIGRVCDFDVFGRDGLMSRLVYIRVPPFVFANGYFGPDHRNNRFQMEFTWITGSVAWFYNVLLQEMLGARAAYDGLRIAPCLPTAWKEASVRRTFRGTIFDITVLNPHGVVGGVVSLQVDGQPMAGDTIPLALADGREHRVVATISAAAATTCG